MSKNIDMSSWFFNQNFNGVSEDFFDDSLGFDDSLNLIDFPLEPENGVVEDWGAKFESVEMPSPDDLAILSSTFCAQGTNEAKKSPVLLNQLPKILEDDRSNSSSSKGSCLFQTSSPVSVLDSSSSSSNSAVGPLVPFNTKITVPAKRRSKRPQKSSSISEPWWKRSPTPDLFPEKALNPLKRKRKKMTSLSQAKDQSETARKCTHCEATKTPQWREGPMGPKTLCNACGVRYRSGRLFPEYRPVASPSFVPSLHSNSHKKVAELRKKAIPTGGDNRASMEILSLPLVQENSLI